MFAYILKCDVSEILRDVLYGSHGMAGTGTSFNHSVLFSCFDFIFMGVCFC